MYVVTTQQPITSLLVEGYTTIFSHAWAPPPEVLDTRLVLHAGSRRPRPNIWPLDVQEAVVRMGGLLPQGAVLGTAYLVEVAELVEVPAEGPVTVRSAATGIEYGMSRDSYVHYEEGRWLWLLSDVRRIAWPVPVMGKQGLWRLPRHVREECRAASGADVSR